MTTVLDISKYVADGNWVNLGELIEQILRKEGYVKMGDVTNCRIDTVAIARMHNVCQATLSKYIRDGLIELGNDRRMSLVEAMSIDFRELKQQAKAARPASRRRH